jgi:hypothetical protein
MFLSILLTLVACGPRDDSGKSDDTGPTINPGGDEEITNLAASTAATMSTVIVVEWDTVGAGSAWVEFGPDDGYGFSTVVDTAPSTHHKIVVAGFPFGDTWHWRAASEIDGATVYSADQEHTSGSRPAGLPSFDLETSNPDRIAHGFRIVPILTSEGGSIFVVNDAADLVWWRTLDYPEVGLQTALAPDGSGIYYLVGDAGRQSDLGEIRYERWDLQETRSVRAEWAHHDFQHMPDGSWAYIAADIRHVDGADYEVAGDAVVLMDEDGSNARTIWDSWEDLEPPDFGGCHPEFYPDYCDWTHANGLAYDPSEEVFYLSIHNDDTFARLELDGTVDWYLGSAAYADYRPATPDDEFVHQHGVKPIADGAFALFDNGDSSRDGFSRMLTVTLDDASQTYAVDWKWNWDSRHSSALLGDHDILENGNHLGSWGSEAVITETTEDYELVWEMSFSLGASTAFTSFTDTLGGVIP